MCQVQTDALIVPKILVSSDYYKKAFIAQGMSAQGIV